MSIIDRAYAGQIRLWKLFWFGYVTPLFPLTVLLGVFKETSSSMPSWLSFVFVMVVLLYQTWLAISIWRCSPNVNHRFFFFFGRVFSGFLGLMVLAAALQILKAGA
jgi:hypothetical protein